MTDEYLRAAWRAYGKRISKGSSVTWADIEYGYSRMYSSRHETGIDFVDKDWIEYDKE